MGSMSRIVEIADLDEERLLELPSPCRGCVYWEAPDAFEKGPNEAVKRDWIRKTREQFGNCGKILYLDGQAAGYALYGPSNRFPAIPTYGSIPVGELRDGAVFLACLVILDSNSSGKGLGKRLLQEVISDLRRRGFAAVETLARAEDANNPSGPRRFYEANGFRTKSVQNPEFPLMRLDLPPLPE